MDFTAVSPYASGGGGVDADNDIDDGSRGQIQIWVSDEPEIRYFPVRTRENTEDVCPLKVVM